MKTGYAITAAITFILTIAFIFGGCYGMRKYIANCKTCEYFNIDNWEVRTYTDIRNGHIVWCRYDINTGTKVTKFEMKIPANEFAQYIAWSGFAPICDTLPAFTIVAAWNDSIQTPNHRLYYKKGCSSKDKWTMILDSNTTTLWAELQENK
jgi:hypothetical protein